MAVTEFTTEELESEEWRPIPGFEGRYIISNLGRFSGRRKSRITRTYIYQPAIDDGYYRVTLYGRSRPKHFGIHRLVAMAFLGIPLIHQTEINHRDGNKLNNRISNLEYCTRAENATHAAETGLLSNGQRHGKLVAAKTPRGERNPAAKLTEAKVLAIRAEYTGKRGQQRALGRRYGVNDTLIGLIVKRRIWTHI